MKEKLLQSILESTKNGTLVWSLDRNMWTCERRYEYETNINDGSTICVDIRLDDNLNFRSCFIMTIKNINLPDGHVYIHDDIKNDISHEIYDRFIKPNIVQQVRTQDDIFSDIMVALPGKQERRDQKIEEILTEKSAKKRNFFNF